MNFTALVLSSVRRGLSWERSAHILPRPHSCAASAAHQGFCPYSGAETSLLPVISAELWVLTASGLAALLGTSFPAECESLPSYEFTLNSALLLQGWQMNYGLHQQRGVQKAAASRVLGANRAAAFAGSEN